MNTSAQKPITLAIAAMGGQGGGVLANWLIAAAEGAGYLAQSTSVPGVAQRTGATIYYLEFFKKEEGSETRDPVLALMPVPGDVDIVIAGELVEAARAVVRGIVTPDRTTMVASTHRDFALSEKMQLGDGRTDSASVTDKIRAASKKFIAFDMAAAAEDTGSVISAVMLGALAGSNMAPFTKDACTTAIREGGVAVERNLGGFEAGFDGAMKASGPVAIEQHDDESALPTATLPTPLIDAFAATTAALDQETTDIVRHGAIRCADYQDIDYARFYLERVADICAADEGESRQLTLQAARYLALRMSFEDTIRVADLKTRRSRFDRFRAEVRAQPDHIVKVTEFMHPRVEEICDTLPVGLGRAILNTPMLRKFLGLFCRSGRKITTTSLRGFLLLYTLSGMKRWRRRTLRYRREQVAISEWLDLLKVTAPSDYQLAVEFARCQRLIKGYGDTHARGMSNYQTILDFAARHKGEPGLADKVAQLREAALADDTGHALSLATEQTFADAA